MKASLASALLAVALGASACRDAAPGPAPAERPIKVTYSYDLNQRMHCAFEDIESGRLLEVDFTLQEDGTLAHDDAAQRATELAPFKVE